jgi:hypothetical protein
MNEMSYDDFKTQLTDDQRAALISLFVNERLDGTMLDYVWTANPEPSGKCRVPSYRVRRIALRDGNWHAVTH